MKLFNAKALAPLRGQATIEYVLMLASVVVIFSAFVTAFHTDMVHYLFSFIGQLLPEGK
ncbi:MAG: hypothetical protein IJ266_04955 [Elusimicrobiaceae bacterium]|nr:hypothetical protein [Elusimicrobiaceae bacterium]